MIYFTSGFKFIRGYLIPEKALGEKKEKDPHFGIIESRLVHYVWFGSLCAFLVCLLIFCLFVFCVMGKSLFYFYLFFIGDLVHNLINIKSDIL